MKTRPSEFATLAGSLNISRINSYDLKAGDSFRILNAASLSGRFDTVNLPPATGGLDLAVTYGTNYVQLDKGGIDCECQQDSD